MEGSGGSSRLKRPLVDDDSARPPMERRPRFPKGKKAKRGDDAPFGDDGGGDGIGEWKNPLLAAKERAKRRNQMREEELFRDQGDISSAEVYYEDNVTFEDDGIRIEPFNLKQEREEGYFDASGNFVEYARQNEIKDAWLDSVDVEPTFGEKNHEKIIPEEDYQDLSSEDIAKLKRSIANLLQPRETIIQALKRLKGTSSDKRGKMSEITKCMFDQLTEAAMKLMENGEYNVYHEERETFEREAEGYERLAHARDGKLRSEDCGSFDARNGEDIFSNGMTNDAGCSSIWDTTPSTSETNASALQVSSGDGGENLDMFGEDDENTLVNLPSDGGAAVTSEQNFQPTSESLEPSQDLDSGGGEALDGGLESDYVYDQSTGYYYSSILGFYYDPASRLYCCATSGIWYSYDESTAAYTEIPNVASTEN